MERVTVAVNAVDPVVHAGIVSLVRNHPVIQVLPDRPTANGPEPQVRLVCVDTVDDAVLARIRRTSRGSTARLILMVSTLREGEMLDVIESGTAAVLWRRDAGAERIVETVLRVARGEGQLPPDLIGRLLDHVGQLRRGGEQRDGAGLAGFAARELDVLRLIAEGLDTGEIALKLAYSERTVKNILHGLMTRMNLRNRAHAVAYAVRQGYLR